MDDLDVDIGSDIDDHMDDAELLPFRYLNRAGVSCIWCNTSAVHEIRRTEGLKMESTLFKCNTCGDEVSYELFLENTMPCNCGGFMVMQELQVTAWTQIKHLS